MQHQQQEEGAQAKVEAEVEASSGSGTCELRLSWATLTLFSALRHAPKTQLIASLPRALPLLLFFTRSPGT